MDKKVEFNYYDVLTSDFVVLPLILAMSEVDAMHIVETKGHTPLDASLSLLDNLNVYK